MLLSGISTHDSPKLEEIMIKAGIFIDSENLVRCGGWGMRYGTVKKIVEA